MKVLWFTNIPLPAVANHVGIDVRGSGHWMSSLLNQLKHHEAIQLGVVTAYPGIPDLHFFDDGVEYFLVHQVPRIYKYQWKSALLKCATIAKNWAPDIIHIHGTESFYGLLFTRNLVNAPTLISLQGFLGACSSWRNYFGNLTTLQILKALRMIEILSIGGLFWDYLDFKMKSRLEIEIVKGHFNFAGRTFWDRAQVWSINPSAKYYHVGEVLRDEFFNTAWDLGSCKRHTVVATNVGHPRRGTETLLDAVQLLRGEFPDLKVNLIGNVSKRNGYGRFLLNRIYRGGLRDCIDLKGYFEPAQIVNLLKESHVFVTTSYIENSSNSLCEAQLVGVPCIASAVGGLPSIVRDGRNGTLFPVGDAVSLAYLIRKLFLDDELCSRIGRQARQDATLRHSPNNVVNQLIDAYSGILNPHP